MAFKMTSSSYNIDNTPIYSTDMDNNILGMAQSNGTILVNKNISPLELSKNRTIEHEKVHINQMKRGDLDYTDSHVIWKNKKYPRSSMKEGAKNLPWEKEAYAKQGKKSPLNQKSEENLYKLKTAFGPKTEKDATKEKERRSVEAFMERSNPKLTRRNIFYASRNDKAWKSLDRFEELNKR